MVSKLGNDKVRFVPKTIDTFSFSFQDMETLGVQCMVVKEEV